MMARILSIRFDGQISSLAKCDEDGWVHLGVGKSAIWSDCRAKAGVVVCHLSVDFSVIGADGCPEAGDFACHSRVDFFVIKADDSCPEAGDFWCHLVVDLGFVGASPNVYACTLPGVASH